MQAFIEVRMKGEAMIRESGIPATFLRPRDVLGPGHWWPYTILPVYWILERLPKTKESAKRLGLITIDQMIHALLWAVENPPAEIQIFEVPQIRRLGASGSRWYADSCRGSNANKIGGSKERGYLPMRIRMPATRRNSHDDGWNRDAANSAIRCPRG